MIDTCINKNSTFMEALESFTQEEKAQITDKLNQQGFIKWYGKGQVDSFGQPKLVEDIYIVNDKREKITLRDLLNDEFYTKRQNYSKDLTSLDKIKKFLKDSNIDLAKRISAYKDSDYAEKIQVLLDYLIKLNENDHLEGLIAHYEYMTKTLEDFELRFHNYDKSKGTQSSKHDDRSYKNFLTHVNNFLQSFSKIRNLDSPIIETSEEREVIENLKNLEQRVTQLLNRTNAEIEAVIRDRLDEFISNPQVKAGIVDFLAAQTDESKIQLLLDALGDSHVTFLAGVDKFFKKTMYEKDEESKRLSRDWDKFINTFKGNFDTYLDKILEKEDSNRTGRFIQRINPEYYNQLYSYINKLQEITDKEGEAYKNTLKDYYAWKRANNKRKVKGQKSEPLDKWISKEYKALNPKEIEDFNYIQKMLLYLTEHSKNDLIKKGFLPAIPKEKILGKVAKEDFSEVAVTESEDIVKFIPFRYVQKLNQTAEIKSIPDGASEEEIKNIEKQNEEAKKANRASHGEALDYNLAETMKTFIKAALTNKYKTNIEVDLKLFKEQLKRQKIKVTNAKGNNLYDKIKTQLSGEKTEYEISAIGSNTQKHFNEWMDAVFYEDFELDEGLLSELTKKIQDFTSLRALGFNVLSGLNNKLIGNIQARIESGGGIYFNYSDYREARKKYFMNMTSFVSNHKTKESNNFIDGFIKQFDILISQDEIASRPGSKIKTLLYKARAIRDTAFFLQHIGEHQIQNATLIAMGNSHRIVDGKIINFNEFWESKKNNITFSKDITEEERIKELNNIKENEEIKKSSKEEFEKFPKLIDSYELKDGYTTLKEGVELNKNEIFNFRERVLGINQRLHGIYNTEDAALLQRNALGRLGMQFRKWMRPGWNRRFGNKFGQRVYNERIRDYEEGIYVSAFKYVFNPTISNWKAFRKQEEKTAAKAFKMILDSIKDTFTNAKIRWNVLSEIEKAGVKKTGLEFLFLISVIALGFAAKNLKGDDDDKSLTLILYQADRLFGELTTYSPIGLIREGNRLFSSPSPVFNTFEDIFKLGTNIFLYPFRDEEETKFKTGIYHGEDKVGIYIGDMLPVYNQIQRINYLGEQNERYGLFK